MDEPRRRGGTRRNPQSESLSIDRRQFLVMVGGAAAYMALRPTLAVAGKAAEGLPTLQPWSLPGDPPANPNEVARALIGAAVLAPSHWNAQPWRFEVEGASIRLVADPQRALPFTDPDRRSMMIGLGAALENLTIAARAWGLRPQVEYLPFEGAGGVVARVSWEGGERRRDRAVLAAIPERRTNRRDYDGRAIYPQNRAQLLAQASGEYAVRWMDDRDAIGVVADLAYEATRAQERDARIAGEHYAWTRSGDDDARRRGDGVTVDRFELGGITQFIAGRSLNPKSWFHRFAPESVAKTVRGGIRSAAALALITAPRGGESSWLMGGQTFQRFALKATELGIAHQPISAPIEMESARAALLSRFGASGEAPLLLVRLGHAGRPDPSVRRAVALVASFRNT